MYPKKGSLFDLMQVGNDCICRICFPQQAPGKHHLGSQLIYEYIDLIQKDYSKCDVTTSKIYSFAVEDNKTANSEKSTILEYKYGVKGNRGLCQ